VSNSFIANHIRRQQGAETVEFLFTLLLFLFIFFLIIDIAILIYNRGAIINASHEGARQASLYWVDPLLFDPTTPEFNQQLKRSVVDSVMSWTETNLLIDPENIGLTISLQINASAMINPVEYVSTTDTVSVDVLYSHSYLTLTALSGLNAPPLISSTTLGVE
jgi:hypothetical protein